MNNKVAAHSKYGAFGTTIGTLIANKLISVQPMSANSGEIFKFHFIPTRISLTDMETSDYIIMLQRLMRFLVSNDRVTYNLNNKEIILTKTMGLIYRDTNINQIMSLNVRVLNEENGKLLWNYSCFDYTDNIEYGVTDDAWDERVNAVEKVLTQALEPYPDGTELSELVEFVEDYL